MDLALRFNGEIINGDAMQMYKGLPIVTNKITPEEARGIPHHLFDFIDPLERAWNVTRFNQECLKTLAEIRGRGKLPILVGGTHFYTQALLFKNSLLDGGIDEIAAQSRPTKDQESKEEREARWPILAASPEEIFARLQEVDPVMAKRWHPKDVRKIRRSLEIWLETGRPASQIYEEQKYFGENTNGHGESGSKSLELRFPTLVFWIRSSQEALRERLDDRVDLMIDAGLVEEVGELVDLEDKAASERLAVDYTSGIWVSIGYKEVKPYLLAQRSSPVQRQAELTKMKNVAIELTKIATRQYSNNQERWIKRKFINAMDAAGEFGHIFPIDSTQPASWQSDVSDKTEVITSAFLVGKPLPDPGSISTMAQELLQTVQEEKAAKADMRVNETHECTMCKKILANKEQWEIHLKSKRHKKVVAWHLKQAAAAG